MSSIIDFMTEGWKKELEPVQEVDDEKEEQVEELYFDKETGYWLGTGKIIKPKSEIDPDWAYDNDRDNNL
jgi:hypothetical protein